MLTHWPLGDVAVILNVYFRNPFYRIVAQTLSVKLLICRTSLMISQHWFRLWLGAMRQPSGLGSNTYLYLQIQIQIQIRRICICICIWSNFKPCICICICIWSIVFGVFDKYVFKYTFSWAVFWTQIYGKRLTWIFFINMLKSAILFQNKCRGLILPIPIGSCVCALDLACQWVCDKPLA